MDTARERRWDVLWLLFWGIASSAWCVSAAGTLGATFDEPGDVASGLEFWHTGSHAKLLRVGAMPLPMDVCALPIYIYERVKGVEVDLLHGDAHVPIFLARTGTLVFWWLLLFYGWRAGRQLAGAWGGRLAVAMLAVEPTFLAHACLATKDIAISACLLALVYHFRLGREAGWWRRIGVPGIWFGVALLAKASALAFGPLCMLAVEIERLLRPMWSTRSASANDSLRESANMSCTRSASASDSRSESPTLSDSRSESPTLLGRVREWRTLLRPWFWDSIKIGLVGLAVTFIYCGSDWDVEPSWVAWARQLPEDNAARAPMVWLSEHVRIFSNAGAALVRQISHNMRGHDGSFILGRAAPRSFWYYFPVALSMKLTIGLLMLPLLLLVLKPGALRNWACVAAGVLLAYSLKCNVQIGVRLMLPLVALGVVGIAAALVRAWQESAPGWRRQLLRGGAVLAVAGGSIASLHVWPHGICYVNELWGGTDRGYLCLSDSNYDWGQGLPELAAWQAEHAQGVPLDVWYFGTDPALETLPLRHQPLHVRARSVDDVTCLVHGRYLAASTTLLYGSYLQTGPSAEVVEFLRRCQPVGRTQTFLIYDFTHAR